MMASAAGRVAAGAARRALAGCAALGINVGHGASPENEVSERGVPLGKRDYLGMFRMKR